MTNKKLFLHAFLIFLFASFYSYSQEIQCTELINYVKSNGYKKSSISSIQLYNSSWLNAVEAYSIENSIVVISKIKKK